MPKHRAAINRFGFNNDGMHAIARRLAARPPGIVGLNLGANKASRDRAADYDAAGAVVIGVSPDPVKAVKKFHGGQSLNFTLLADEDHAVCDLYGTWVEKSMYGKKYWGAQRSTFIIDGDGTVAHVIEKASPKTHDDEVLGVLAAA